MGCCNQGRAALRTKASPLRVTTSQHHVPSPAADVQLQYIGVHEQRLRGSSGRIYQVMPGLARVDVAIGDAGALLRTGLFVDAPGQGSA